MTASGAIFSDDGVYRYALWRQREPSMYSDRRNDTVVFIGLNPSTAGETDDDPTVRRWRGFAIDWGFGWFMVGNLFAFKATYPKRLIAASDPVGKNNDWHLRQMCKTAYTVVLCHGSHQAPSLRGMIHRRHAEVVKMLEPTQRLWCFGKTKDGMPRHPLYLKATTRLVLFRREDAQS